MSERMFQFFFFEKEQIPSRVLWLRNRRGQDWLFRQKESYCMYWPHPHSNQCSKIIEGVDHHGFELCIQTGISGFDQVLGGSIFSPIKMLRASAKVICLMALTKIGPAPWMQHLPPCWSFYGFFLQVGKTRNGPQLGCHFLGLRGRDNLINRSIIAILYLDKVLTDLSTPRSRASLRPKQFLRSTVHLFLTIGPIVWGHTTINNCGCKEDVFHILFSL